MTPGASLRDRLLLVAVYLIATALTGAHFMGDTFDYAESIRLRALGQDFFFWEFGHVLWRPLGFVLFEISNPLTRWLIGSDARADASAVLIGLAWLGGLISVLALYGILRRVVHQRWVLLTSVLGFVFANAFLNYFHTGAPYIPGLSLLLLGMYLLLPQTGPEFRASRALFAGASLAGAILLWFPYCLVVPAVLVFPFIHGGINKQRLLTALQAGIVCAIITGGVYIGVMTHIHIHSVQDFRAWMTNTSRGSGSPNKGVTRVIFGFARSFINMGNDGMFFKRFLLHDPFNPVSAVDLVRLSLWKLVAFYLFLGIILLSLLWGPRSRRALLLLALSGLPVIAFAVYWQGGDPERYLPLYPALFISLACALDNRDTKSVFKGAVLLFLLGMALTNVLVMRTSRLNRQQEASASRIREVVPNFRRGSWLFTANWQDDLVNFNRSFPLNPLNGSTNNLLIGSLVNPGDPEVAYWRRWFATRAEKIWSNDGDVWVSRRLLSPRPRSDWNWVEGDDDRVSWNDLYRYASKLELGPALGGDDGFSLLLPTEENKRYLAEQSEPESNHKQ